MNMGLAHGLNHRFQSTITMIPIRVFVMKYKRKTYTIHRGLKSNTLAFTQVRIIALHCTTTELILASQSILILFIVEISAKMNKFT
jgi:hypothetical protein